MPEVKTRSFADDVLRGPRGAIQAANDDATDRERQPGAQAATLRVRFKGGKRIEGFPWSFYAGYQWLDSDETESIAILFGERMLIVEGHRLALLLRDIDDLRKRHLVELAEPEADLALASDEKDTPVITRLTAYPDFKEMIDQIKGENSRETRFTKRFER